MGTRNVTIIIQNGETKVRQYGQWDGYPTTALRRICEVLKNHLPELEENVRRCRLVKENLTQSLRESSISRKAISAFEKISDSVMYDHTLYRGNFDSEREWFEHLCHEFPAKDVQDYILQTRDTGYIIVEDIATCPFDGELLMPDCKITRIGGKGFSVVAINTIDLDKREIRAEWHDKKSTWSFANLPSDEELEKFEALS